MAADNNDGKKIQLNRKMRLWNKYKNPIIGAVSVIVIVIAAVVVLRACSVGKQMAVEKRIIRITTAQQCQLLRIRQKYRQQQEVHRRQQLL